MLMTILAACFLLTLWSLVLWRLADRRAAAWRSGCRSRDDQLRALRHAHGEALARESGLRKQLADLADAYAGVSRDAALAAGLRDANAALAARIARGLARGRQVLAERDSLAKFKAYVHTTLTAYGVPANPDPEQTARTGCRIGPRLLHVFTERMRLRQSLDLVTRERGKYLMKLTAIRRVLDAPDAVTCRGKTARPEPLHAAEGAD